MSLDKEYFRIKKHTKTSTTNDEPDISLKVVISNGDTFTVKATPHADFGFSEGALTFEADILEMTDEYILRLADEHNMSFSDVEELVYSIFYPKVHKILDKYGKHIRIPKHSISIELDIYHHHVETCLDVVKEITEDLTRKGIDRYRDKNINIKIDTKMSTKKARIYSLDDCMLWYNTASLDVDAQCGFTPLCPDELPVPDGDSIVAALNAQAKFARIRVGSKDWHPVDAMWLTSEDKPQFTPIEGYPNLDLHWNAHCIARTKGAELLPGLPKTSEYDFMVYKGMEIDMHPYGACYHDLEHKISTGLIEYLKSQKIKRVLVGGLAFDYCVRITAIQLSKHFHVVVNKQATRAITTNELELASIESELQNNGVEVIDPLGLLG